MGYYLGIDLGSTTTKAVVMDDREQIIGRGITNTRSNYNVATQIAGNEAMNSARFYLLRKAVGEESNVDKDSDEFFNALKVNFRYLQQMDKLGRLKANCLELADNAQKATAQAALHEAIAVIFASMESRSRELFSTDSLERSQFFRDIVGSEFLRMADKQSSADGLSFEDLMGVYDKSILKVENQVLEGGFKENIKSAMELTMRQPGLSERKPVKKVKETIEKIETSDASSFHQSQAGQFIAEGLPMENTVGTGYGRQRLPFRKDQIRSEILCHGLGAHFMFPGTSTVLDIGGQDTKAIQVDEHGIVKSFQMNDRCAAGCGRYLGYIADELNIGLHELGPLSLQSSRTVRINSTCTVFAGAELRERMSLGESRENILAGLHRAIILRAMSLLARSGGVFSEFTFTGGVARNPAVVKSLGELVSEHYNVKKVNIHPDSIYTGAVGAALFALRG